MARPNLVRADTLDLQDEEHPTAAEHTKPDPLQPNGLAPHLAAQVHHVIEERHSEEQSLQEAWNIADNLVDSPDAIDRAQANNAQKKESNGASHEEEEDGENGDQGEDGDGDDDMMDRISSSPSIDEGGYTLHSSPPMMARRCWPTRSSSLSPAYLQHRETFNQSASPTSSSPFTQTPQHPPIRARLVDIVRRAPFMPARSSGTSTPTSKHHQQGRYAMESGTIPELDENEQGEDEFAGQPLENDWTLTRRSSESDIRDLYSSKPQHVPMEDGQHNESPLRNQAFARSMSDLDPSPSFSSITSADIRSFLMPMNDPLLDTPYYLDDESAGSWDSLSESESEASDQGFEDNDDADAHFFNVDERYIDSGWGGECLRETEDIDFEFVYALHTFVATVEGQANATKGDTMVLLDDSNSYWWLVRVVKDSSIGYLPAEHIETPTERLARLNKHRNIDLSATMLSDNSEKSRNPLKKAMRRRNAKTVQFAAPTYVEASDYDYSSEDEDNMIDPYGDAAQSDKGAQNDSEDEPEEQKVETKDHITEGRSSTSSNRASFDREQAATAAQALAAAGIKRDDDVVQPKLIDKTGEYDYLQSDLDRKPTVSVEAAPLKSRKTRNTDSFLKDDTIETRKITLTPGLLRDESASLKSPVEEQSTRGSSFETLTKITSPTEPAKKELRDKKELKKGGLLSGLFKSKKKEKKSREDANDQSDGEKLSTELGRDSPRISPLPSGTNSPIDRTMAQLPGGGRTFSQRTVSSENMHDSPMTSNSGFIAELPGSEAAYEMATGQEENISESQRASLEDRVATPVPQEKTSTLSSALSPIANVLKTGDKDGKPPKAKRAKQRVQLDDFDSPQDEREQNPLSDDEADRSSESPVERNSNTFMHGTESIHIPMPDTDDEKDSNTTDAPASLSSSPSLIDHPDKSRNDEVRTPEDNDPTPTARSPQPQPSSKSQSQQSETRDLRLQPTFLSTGSTTTSSSTPPSSNSTSPILAQQQPWSDSSLRAWLEDGSEVRDMLIMIHDKTGVTPAPADHPLMSGLFVEERKGVQNMMGELDGLLGKYLQRKGVQY